MQLLLDIADCMNCNDRMQLVNRLFPVAPIAARAVIMNTVWDVKSVIDVTSIEVAMPQAEGWDTAMRSNIFWRARTCTTPGGSSHSANRRSTCGGWEGVCPTCGSSRRRT